MSLCMCHMRSFFQTDTHDNTSGPDHIGEGVFLYLTCLMQFTQVLAVFALFGSVHVHVNMSKGGSRPTSSQTLVWFVCGLEQSRLTTGLCDILWS